MNYNFKWDPNKAKTNRIKHKVSFEDASSVFKDKMAVSVYDEEHSAQEERWITIGLDLNTRTIIVVHTFIIIDEQNCNIRIISARRATKKEEQIYYQKD